MNKWAIVFEYDLQEGVAYLAREKMGEGAVVLFDTKEQAKEWTENGENIDSSCFDINYIKIN